MSKSRLYAHRGYWNVRGSNIFEPNSREAILNAITNGFAVETDIRGYQGRIVISHDPVTDSDLTLKELLSYQGKFALNVKSDGLAPALLELVESENYFLFDMSIPEYQKYKKTRLNTYGRLSEYETESQYVGAEGMWVDGFITDWWCKPEILELLLKTTRQYIFVSPELHGRNPRDSWDLFAPYFQRAENFALCTDHPDLFLELI